MPCRSLRRTQQSHATVNIYVYICIRFNWAIWTQEKIHRHAILQLYPALVSQRRLYPVLAASRTHRSGDKLCWTSEQPRLQLFKSLITRKDLKSWGKVENSPTETNYTKALLGKVEAFSIPFAWLASGISPRHQEIPTAVYFPLF